MLFKNPEILYFLLLLIVPILVHLFQLRRFKTEYFTNVKFLKELSIQTRKSSKIKKYLLLASRLLLLFCLIFAFAQPFFKSKDSQNAHNELYIILDNSYSMQAKGKKGELMKRAVQDLLENTIENQQFSLLTNSESYWNTDIKSIQKELQELDYAAHPFVLDNILAKINTRKSAFNKDIVVITDAVNLDNNQLKSFYKNDKTFFIIPEAEQIYNVSVDSVFINQNLEKFYEIAINLSVYGDKKQSIPIAVYNKNKLIAKTIFTAESNLNTIKFTIPKVDFHGFVSIEDKGLTFDNKLFFSISKPEKISVIAIGESLKNDFLNRIYTTEEFDFQEFELNVLDYNLIEKQDAIVLNELINIPQALQITLKDFVSKGGNLIIIPSTENAVENINSLVKIFGNLQFNSIENIENTITKINFSHPLFSSVFEKKIDNFQYPSTQKSFEIKSSYAPILSYANQQSFLISMPQTISNVYVFAAPINKSNSNFQNSPLIVPVFYNMAQNFGATAVSSITIGKSKPILIDALLGKDEILNIKNNSDILKENFIPIQQIMNNKVKLSFNENPKYAGNFEVFNQNKLIKNISFNYDRTESNIENVNKNLLSDYEIVDSIETVFDTIHINRTDNYLWKWFVIWGLLFLIAEIFIQKYVK